MKSKHIKSRPTSTFQRTAMTAGLLTFCALSAFAAGSFFFGDVLKKSRARGRDYLPDEVIIKYTPEATATKGAHAATLSRLGARRIRALPHSPLFVHVKLPAGKSVESAISELASDPNVELVQPNYIYHATATTVPNDPDFSKLWGLLNTGQPVTALSSANNPDLTDNPPGASGNDMDLAHAWNTITDCSSIIVAVIDSGIKYDHEDLSANMWNSGDVNIPNHGWNVISGAVTPNDPMDDAGHGTHVAGTIGAVGNNGVGTTGICWRAKLMAVKALGEDGSGSTADIATGISWAASHGARVINMSLGGTLDDATMDSAINSVVANDVLIVVAAGNDGTDNDATPHYPCNSAAPNLICVAALDQAYALAPFSDYGAATVDVGAPGVNIASTWPFAVTGITDAFSSGWTYAPASGGWGFKTLTSSGVSFPTLVDPSNWNGTNDYAANAEDHVYKTFDLSGIFKADLAYQLQYSTQANTDFFQIYNYGSGGDPVTSGTAIDTDSGNGAYFDSELPISSSCLTSTCSIGLRFTSNANTQSTGIIFLKFQLNKSVYTTSAYNVLEGTSMATPHVTGLAAMLFAYNPGFHYTDVATAIRNGGVVTASLAGKTKTGRAVSAMGSLSYIQAPAGVSALKF